MGFADKDIRGFIEVLSSKEPVPGGGGASALVGSIGLALGSMVGSLTTGKKKYAEVEEDIQILMVKSGILQDELLELMDKDAEVFAPLAKAYSMPKATKEELEIKEAVMEKALKDACEVPLRIMEKSCEALKLIEEFAQKGSVIAISDAGVGAAFCRGALNGASLNVFINTKSMKDRTHANVCNSKAEQLMDTYNQLADKIFESVKRRLQS